MDKVKKIRALTTGSIVIDTIAVIANNDIERITMHNATTSFLLLEQGRKVDAKGISNHIGGGAANVGVSFARLGLDVSVMGTVGDDLNADKARASLLAEGVNLDNVRVDPEHGTGCSLLVSSHDQNAAIFTHRGANGHLSEDHVDGVDFSQYDLVHIAPLSNNSADRFPQIVEKAKAAGCFVSTNPGIRQLTSKMEPLFDTISKIDLVSLNKSEVSSLVPRLAAQGTPRPEGPIVEGENLPPLLESGLRFGGFVMGLDEIMSRIQALGPKNVLITDGKGGAYLLADKTLTYCRSRRIEPRGTAGAGDGFVSTLTALLAMGRPPEEALKAATINSASVVSYVDTQHGLLTLDDVKTELKKSHLETQSWT